MSASSSFYALWVNRNGQRLWSGPFPYNTSASRSLEMVTDKSGGSVIAMPLPVMTPGEKREALPLLSPSAVSEDGFRVSWEMDVEAPSPAEAARKALRTHRNPESVATVFTVTSQKTGRQLTVDLTEGTCEKKGPGAVTAGYITTVDPTELLPGDTVLGLSEHEEDGCHCDVRVTIRRVS